MDLTRKEFLALAAATCLAGCAGGGVPGEPNDKHPGPWPLGGKVDAGPVSNYADQQVYETLRASHGLFIVRQGNTLFAESAICTHRHCKLRVKEDHSFICPCHGSTFDTDGQVTRGPAQQHLPHYALHLDDQKHVIVDLSKPVLQDQDLLILD